MISKWLAVRRVLLGCFVIWQLVFVVQANCYDFTQSVAASDSESSTVGVSNTDRSPGDWITEANARLRGLTTAYEQLTGQEQGWALFWNARRDTGFVAVEFRWDDAPSGAGPRAVWLLSDNEPRSVSRYFRSSQFRLRRVENELEIDTWSAAAIEQHVRRHGDLIHTYLQWRLRTFSKDPSLSVVTGGMEPTHVKLIFRRYRIRAPELGEPYVHGPLAMPIACWRPQAAAEEGFLLLESYDPSRKRFIRLRAHE